MKYSFDEIINLNKAGKLNLYSYLYDEFYNDNKIDLKVYWHFLNDPDEDISKLCYQILVHHLPDSVELFDYSVQFLREENDETDKQMTIIGRLPTLNLNDSQRNEVIGLFQEIYKKSETSSDVRGVCFCSILTLQYSLKPVEMDKINGAMILDFDDIDFENFSMYLKGEDKWWEIKDID